MDNEWKMVQLGDICDIQAGGTPSRHKNEYWINGTIPWVKIGDMDSKFISSTNECITEIGLKKSAAKLFPKGTLLFSIFATLGAVSILDIDATTNQAIAGINIKKRKEVFNSFLYYYLISIRKDIEKIGRGVAQNNINLGILKKYLIPIPPIDKQQEIAQILDKANELIEKRKEQLRELNCLAESIFYDMFGDPVTNSNKFTITRLNELFTVTSSKRVYQSQLTEAGIPFFKIADLVRKIEDQKLSNISHISTDLYNKLISSDLVPQKDDILITSRGTLGRCYIVQENDKFYFQDGMISWLKNSNNQVINIYIVFLFNTDYIKMQINSDSNGATVNYLSLENLKKLNILLPPLHLQHQFASIIEKIEAQKAKVKEALKESEDLFQRLMQDMFNPEYHKK